MHRRVLEDVDLALRSLAAVIEGELVLAERHAKHVAHLEDRVGVRLFDRTTRRVALTEAGRVYLERCTECLRVFEEADHAEVTVGLHLSNRPVDLVHEGIDIAVRIGSPSLEGDLIARVLAPISVIVLAAPDYLERFSRPKRPDDLRSHRSMVFVEPRPRLEWTFERDGKRRTVVLAPVLSSNSGSALLTAACEGAGVTMAPSFLARSFVDAGRLVPLLEGWRVVPDLKLYAVYPHRRFLSPNVTAFIEVLRAYFGDGKRDPFWP